MTGYHYVFSIESMIRGYHEYKAGWDDPEDHSDLATMRLAYNILKSKLSPDTNDYGILVIIRIT